MSPLLAPFVALLGASASLALPAAELGRRAEQDGFPIKPSYNVSSCPGYKASNVKRTSSGLTADLILAGPACNAFGIDYQSLVLSVTYETSSRLHFHLTDKNKTQFELPESVWPRPFKQGDTAAGEAASDLDFSFDEDHFAFWITRKRNGEVLFDTRAQNIPTYDEPLFAYENSPSITNSTRMPKHELIFENQYLQLSSALPRGANLYGLGEYYSGNFRRDPDSTLQPFFALDNADPVDANMYGYHPVYYESRASSGGTHDAHSVFYLNTAGMDVILRPGVIQYRAIGGALDFYFLSGDAEPSKSSAHRRDVGLEDARKREKSVLDGPLDAHAVLRAEEDGDISDVIADEGAARKRSNGKINSAVTAIEQYVQTISLPQVPPVWGFGFHLCRWGYQNISVTQGIVDSMRAANVPLETQWNDIDWMDSYRDFIPAPNRFAPSEYKAFVDKLHADHQHYIPIIDGAIGVQIPNGTDRYDVYTKGTEMDVFIKNPNGTQYIGQVWPGFTGFPDWHAENSQAWWNEAFKNFSNIIDFDGIWEDMNEPSSFCVGSCGTGANWSSLGAPDQTQTIVYGWPEGYDNTTFGNSGNMTVNGQSTYKPDADTNFRKRAASTFSVQVDAAVQGGATVYNSSNERLLDYPPYAIHNAYGPLDEKTVAMNATTALGPFYDVKNIWGKTSELRTHDALLNLRPTKRPFVIARSTFPGAGRHAGHWLGDNFSTWRYMWHSIQGVLQFQGFGIMMVGADVCGFNGNTDEELCNRWMSLGAWTPFFRNHATKGSLPQEPFRWDSVAEASRKVIAARYSLLPLWSTLLARASEYGTPAIRALWQEWPNDGYESVDRQFLVGDSLLVTPVLVPNVTSVKGVFPGQGPWRDFWDHTTVDAQPGVNTTMSAPLGHIPVHIRPGSVLTMWTKPAYTTYETQQSTYALVVSLDKGGSASGEAYFDDGETQWMDKAPGKTVTYQAGSKSVSANVDNGNFNIERPLEQITVLGVLNKPAKIELDGKAVQWTFNQTTNGIQVTGLKGDLNKAWKLTWS